MIKDQNIFKWVKNSIDTIQKGVPSIDTHLDEFVEYDMKNPSQILDFSCTVFNVACTYFRTNNTDSSIRINMFIELKPCKKLIPVLRNKQKLLKAIDLDTVPEIIMYRENTIREIPKIEFYRSILPFKICLNSNDNYRIFYKAYRDEESLKNKDEFSREINFLFE